MPLVKSIVARVQRSLPRGADTEGLLGAGLIGLLLAVDHFSDSYGVPFEAYARTRVRCAVQDELRHLDHLSRGQRRRARQSRDARNTLAAAGQETDDQDVASEAGLSLADVQMERLHGAPPAAWEPTALSDTVTCTPWQEAFDVEASVNHSEELEQLKVALQQLGERDQLLAGLYYQEGLNLTEIGTILGVSPSRVSQLLARMRSRIAAQMQL